MVSSLCASILFRFMLLSIVVFLIQNSSGSGSNLRRIRMVRKYPLFAVKTSLPCLTFGLKGETVPILRTLQDRIYITNTGMFCFALYAHIAEGKFIVKFVMRTMQQSDYSILFQPREGDIHPVCLFCRCFFSVLFSHRLLELYHGRFSCCSSTTDCL